MAGLEYLDFDLAVEATPTPGTYQVSVLASPRGEASGQMVFPFNADALENVILKLGRTRTGVRSLGSPTQGVAEKFGGDLFDALFAGEVGSRFESSLDEASDEGKGLRIRLRLGRAPQLADVPWEYLYWASRRRFLVLSSKTPVVRYLEQPRSVTPRIGQGRFRRAVDEAYAYRCAVTGSRTYPSLEAAHIRDFAQEGGTHAVSNALLLRSDVHTLYDRGYVGVDADLRLRVSPELRAHGWNGAEFYAREADGFRISVPEAPHLQPDREALDWHFTTRFRAA